LLTAGTRNAPLKRLRAHGEATRADVLAKAKQQLAAGHSPDAVLDFLAHTLTNRLLHAPTVALRQAAITGDTELMRVVDHLLHGPDADTSGDGTPGDRTEADRDEDAADAAP
jgi:glutamyl-tRNA reductase